VYTTGGYFMSPLGAALRGGHLKIAQILYERGADVDVQGYNNSTPLYGASASGHFEIVEWLLNHRANPKHRGGSLGWTSPLHGAAYSGDVEVSRLLLQYKADINAQARQGRTPLHVAVAYRHVDVARLLLEHGADLNARDENGSTAFQLASERGYDIANLLSDHGSK
jgi:ankyrin repeat protein